LQGGDKSGIKDVADEGAFAGAADAGDADQAAEGIDTFKSFRL